jgi:transcriptional regulator with XRE-family HTH domain
MTYPAYIREKARKLRTERRMSIDEIAECLAISRTTIHYWTRDIPSPDIKYADSPARARARAKGNRAMQAKYSRLRAQAYEAGRNCFAALDRDYPTFRDFVVLFMTEGFKRNRNVVSIANSDPAIVELATRWLRLLSPRKITYSIQYHADQNLEMLREFWGSRLAINPERIVLQRKSNSNGLTGRNWRSRFGVMTVCSNDTYLRSRLEAWMDCLRREWLDSPSLGV